LLVAGVALTTLFYWGRVSYFASGAFQAIPMLEGVVLALAFVLLLVSLSSRKWLYVLFAGWLVGNLRLTALSMGWDSNWLGHPVPAEFLPLMRSVTIALYYILTYALFSQLFAAELQEVGYKKLQRVGQLLGLGVFAAAVFMRYDDFIPFMWGMVGLAVCIACFFLFHIISLTRSAEPVWYSAALCVVIAIGSGALSHLARWAGINYFDETAMHIAAAFVSSLLIALVIANSERNERQSRIRAQDELRRVYHVTPIGLFTLDMKGRIVRANPALQSMLGLGQLDTDAAIWENQFGRQAWIKLVNAIEQDGEAEIEIRNLRESEAVPRRSFLVKAVLQDERIEGSLQDITGHADTISRLRIEANRDPLTDALNQKGIDLQLEESLRRLSEGETFVLGYLELNSLKTVNNLYGKSTGDDVLRQICDRARELFGVDAQLGRLTGSEFLIFFVNVTLEKARQLCQALLDDLRLRPCLVAGEPSFKFKASLGLVGIERTQIEPQDAMLVAKRAAREARRQGLGQVVTHNYTAHQLAEQAQELRLLRRFTSGFDVEGFSLVMQPIMSLSDPFGSLNFEVLLRMHDKSGALVPTGKIIAAAEESGIISQIDRWVVWTTLKWLTENQHRLENTEFVCVNLNGMSLNDDQFISEFFTIFERFAPVARKLLVEITESVALQDMAHTRDFILRLQSMGARVALDDFGAGYTSFAYLKQLPANALKIDGAFIRSMNQNDTDVAIVRAIVELARSLNMISIAEWAEDVPTLRTLKDLGVDYVQGYVIARPQSPEMISHAANSAGFIDDPKTRQFVSYYVRPSGQQKTDVLL
jgi:diguanylate cyclase (GGDEF)-like protein